VPVFRGDDAYGTALATNHLISLGHKRIAMIGGTDQTSTGRDRYQGYCNAMDAAGLEIKPSWRIRDLAPSKRGLRRRASSWH
jgi:DNA-binding LacI/PurR family transcriptional regulator